MSPKSFLLAVLAGAVALSLSACGGSSSGDSGSSSSSSDSSSSSSSEPQSFSIELDPGVEYQTVDGFGGALPMWNVTTPLTDEEVHTLVGMGEGELGFTLLRTIVDPFPDDWSRAADSLNEAKNYSNDVRILAAPWSPPAEMKDNNSTTDGGELLESRYGDYADHLNAYIDTMLEQGVVIDVMSIQNEPDYATDYQSAEWTGDQLRRFVRDYGAEVDAEILIAESLRFDRDYTDPALNDEQALANLDYVGGHLYSAEDSGTFTPYPLAEEKGVPRWMTEWNYHEADGEGAPIWGGNHRAVWAETLDVVLASVHQTMEVNWNAYIWWWSLRFYSFLGDGDSDYGTERGEVLKRGWAFSHYSKFVRPGHVRIGAELSEEAEEVYVTAYTDGQDKRVLVILNRADHAYESVAIETPEAVGSAEGYVTTRLRNRETLSLTLSDGELSLPELPARSVVTLVMGP